VRAREHKLTAATEQKQQHRCGRVLLSLGGRLIALAFPMLSIAVAVQLHQELSLAAGCQSLADSLSQSVEMRTKAHTKAEHTKATVNLASQAQRQTCKLCVSRPNPTRAALASLSHATCCTVNLQVQVLCEARMPWQHVTCHTTWGKLAPPVSLHTVPSKQPGKDRIAVLGRSLHSGRVTCRRWAPTLTLS
jgi:hypothetical protein